MKLIGIALFTLIFQAAYSQSLNSERVNKIKQCTVRITIEGSDEMGTGFFIDNYGSVLTCWHVISPSLVFTNGSLTDLKKIYITESNGTSHQVNIPLAFIHEKSINAQKYDYCLLTPSKPFKTGFLKIGSFKDINYGDEIYACGYPLGMTNQFISRGIFSTKYIDSSNNKIKVERGYLDITLNKGNSGGAILKIGKTVSEDEVIGLAEFIVNTYSKPYQDLKNLIDKAKGSGNVFILGVPMDRFISLVLQAIEYSSNGISGCISIDYFKKNINSNYSDYK